MSCASSRPVSGAPTAWPSSAATKKAEAAGPGVREIRTPQAIRTVVAAVKPSPKSRVAIHPVHRSAATASRAVPTAVTTRLVNQADLTPRRSSSGANGAESAHPSPSETQARTASPGATPAPSSTVRP